MEKKVKKDLIFVENKEQVSFFSNYFSKPNFSENYQVIAIGSSAQNALIDLKIPFTKSLSFFSNNDHILIIEKANEIIEIMKKDFYLSDKSNIKNAYKNDFFSFFRFYYLNYVLSLILIIDNAVKHLNPNKLILPSSLKPIDIQNHITPSSSLLGYLANEYCKEKNIETVLVGKLKINNISNKPKKINHLLEKIIFIFQLFIYKISTKNKNIIWATSDSYNIPRVMNYLEKNFQNPYTVGGSNLGYLKVLMMIFKGKGMKFYKFPPPANKKDIETFNLKYEDNLKVILKKIQNHPDIFFFKGVYLNKIISDYLGNGLKRQVKKTFFGSLAFLRILRIKKPSFLISNQAASYHYAIGEHCLMQNVNAMLISHGTHVLHKDLSANLAWKDHARYMVNTHFPLVSVQTPYAKEFLDNENEVISKQVITGPLIYSKKRDKNEIYNLRKKFFPSNFNKKIILHAASPFDWYVFHPFVNLTQDEYVDHINHLIKAAEKLKDVFLVVKIRSKSFQGLSLNQIKSLFVNSNCYEVFVDGNFEDYLLCSDLLISFSSTVIEEALQVEIPVLQYDPFNRYSHIPIKKMNKDNKPKISSIYYVANEKDLFWSLKWIKNNHLQNKHSEKLINWSSHIIKSEKDWLKPYIK